MKMMYIATILASRTKKSEQELQALSYTVFGDTEDAAFERAMKAAKREFPTDRGWQLQVQVTPMRDDVLRHAYHLLPPLTENDGSLWLGDVLGEDSVVSTNGEQVIFKAPDGSRWRATVSPEMK